MKILVTGGSGFIGRHLIEALYRKGHQVSTFDHHPTQQQVPVDHFQGDIRDEDAVRKAVAGHDVVYHLAGILGTHELMEIMKKAVEINVIGTLNVLDAVQKHDARMVLASKPNIWLNTYSLTKEMDEKFCLMFNREFGTPVAIVKWYNAYGPRQKTHGVQKAVPTFIMRALKNEPIPIFGNGHQTADFIYVTELAEATARVAEEPGCFGRIIEIGMGKETTVNELANLIISLTGSHSQLDYLPMRSGETPDSKVFADCQTMHDLLGFYPQIELEDGLKQTISYYQELLANKVDVAQKR